MSANTQQLVERLKCHFSGTMSEEEIAFLEDIRGFIDFTIRNGLNFGVVLSTLAQDINEVARDGYDLKQTLAHRYTPRVAGYRNINAEDFGASELE